jgi:hypothetical protein
MQHRAGDVRRVRTSEPNLDTGDAGLLASCGFVVKANIMRLTNYASKIQWAFIGRRVCARFIHAILELVLLLLAF